MTPSGVAGYLNGIEPLGGNNFEKWKTSVILILMVLNKDLSLNKDKPTEPAAAGDNDPTLAKCKRAYEEQKEKWERADRVAIMLIDNSISPEIRDALPKNPRSPKAFLASIEEYLQSSSKAGASVLMTKMMHAKYDGCGSVREHILMLIDIFEKLKDLEMPLPEDYLVHYIMMSLPAIFDTFKVNYNNSDTKWKLSTLIARCSEEEERLRNDNKDFVNLIALDAKGNSVASKSGGKICHLKKNNFKGKKPYDRPKKNAPKNEAFTSNKEGPKCHHCKKHGHIRKDCEEFKKWLAKKGIEYRPDYKKGGEKS